MELWQFTGDIGDTSWNVWHIHLPELSDELNKMRMQKLFRSNAIAVTIWRLLSKCIIIVTFEWNFVIIFPVNPLPLCHLSGDVDYQFRRHSSGHFTAEREKQSSLISPPSIKIRFCLSFYTWSSPFHPFHPFVSNWMMLQNFSPCVNAHPCLHSSCLSLPLNSIF